MTLKAKSVGVLDAPYIHYPENTRILMANVILAMAIIYVMAVAYYGPRALVLMLVSMGTCQLTDWLCTLLARRRPNLRDLSAVVTGMLLPLLMPASVEYRIVVAAAVFAIAIAKHPFGGVGHNVFNPAAAGFAFVAICFGQSLFRYPMPTQWLPLFAGEEQVLVTAPSFTLNLGGVPKYDLVDMALGNYPGPMGATNILVILACLLFLIFRNTVRWRVPVFFFLTAAAVAWLFPRSPVGRELSVLYEMMSGMLLFGGVFMMGDPVTSPKRGWSQAAYAVTAGGVLMLFRYFGNLEGEFAFALMIMNSTVWGFDMAGERVASLLRRNTVEHFRRKKVSKKA